MRRNIQRTLNKKLLIVLIISMILGVVSLFAGVVLCGIPTSEDFNHLPLSYTLIVFGAFIFLLGILTMPFIYEIFN